jgi:hypothetical protein
MGMNESNSHAVIEPPANDLRLERRDGRYDRSRRFANYR